MILVTLYKKKFLINKLIENKKKKEKIKIENPDYYLHTNLIKDNIETLTTFNFECNLDLTYSIKNAVTYHIKFKYSITYKKLSD